MPCSFFFLAQCVDAFKQSFEPVTEQCAPVQAYVVKLPFERSWRGNNRFFEHGDEVIVECAEHRLCLKEGLYLIPCLDVVCIERKFLVVKQNKERMERRIFVCKVKQNHFLKNLLTVAALFTCSHIKTRLEEIVFICKFFLIHCHRWKFRHELK